MPNLTPTVTNTLSLLTIAGDVVVVGLLLCLLWVFLTKRRKGMAENVLQFFGTNALAFSLVVASLATLGSLFYSEVAGFTPCKLCWIQRIFMYPQMLILGIATWKNDKTVSRYVIPLSAIGILFAGYHYALQRLPNLIVPCTTVGFSLGCSEQFVMNYGYITIPMMSLTAFLMIFVFFVSSKVIKR